MLSILYFMAVWSLFASVHELRPLAMASVASALSSGRHNGLGEFPFTPANSRCPRFFEPWPVGLYPCTSVTSTLPAMEFAVGVTVPARSPLSSLPQF